MSDDAKALIRAILVPDPCASHTVGLSRNNHSVLRPTIAEIRAHPWMLGYMPLSLPSNALSNVPKWKEKHLQYRRETARENIVNLAPTTATTAATMTTTIAVGLTTPPPNSQLVGRAVAAKRGIKRRALIGTRSHCPIHSILTFL